VRAAAVAPALVEVEVLGPLGGSDDTCLYCPCRSEVSYCGRYVSGPLAEGEWADAECCDECVRVESQTGCPSCGCRFGQGCKLCAENGPYA
jgi:hypothetical protein